LAAMSVELPQSANDARWNDCERAPIREVR
jgi:hypothetical protein